MKNSLFRKIHKKSVGHYIGLLLMLLVGLKCRAANPSTPIDYSEWNSIDAIQSSGVKYAPLNKIFDKLNISWEVEGYIESIGPGYKFGNFIEGKYKGAEFIVAQYFTDGPCKGEGCDENVWLRFVKTGNQLIYLPKNSDLGELQSGNSWKIWQTTFSVAGLSLVSDPDFSVPTFSSAESFSHPPEIYQIVSRNCPTSDGGQLKKVFHNDIFQSVYFDQQFFYVFRPDGSCLTYEYLPYFSEKDITWDISPKESSKGGYSWKKKTESGRPEVKYDPFISSDVIHADRDLKIVGHTQRGDAVYELKDPNNSIQKGFYDDYVREFEEAESRAKEPYGHWNESGIQPPKKSYSQFLEARPIFFWKDPFGRLTRFTNNDFLPVYMAEPIIYLYPVSQQRVHVSIEPKNGVNTSLPSYHDGWDVMAEPSGQLTEISENKTYPYLFWDGLSSALPMREEGFVIARNEVSTFWGEMLPKLGLNSKETKDFIAAWLPRFHQSPYYFITFIPQNTIDQLAPLVINPKPETVIRVLMDYRPLRNPEKVKAPEFLAPPRRQGFTVVEWGGINR